MRADAPNLTGRKAGASDRINIGRLHQQGAVPTASFHARRPTTTPDGAPSFYASCTARDVAVSDKHMSRY
jgi:hypothetical protein